MTVTIKCDHRGVPLPGEMPKTAHITRIEDVRVVREIAPAPTTRREGFGGY